MAGILTSIYRFFGGAQSAINDTKSMKSKDIRKVTRWYNYFRNKAALKDSFDITERAIEQHPEIFQANYGYENISSYDPRNVMNVMVKLDNGLSDIDTMLVKGIHTNPVNQIQSGYINTKNLIINATPQELTAKINDLKGEQTLDAEKQRQLDVYEKILKDSEIKENGIFFIKSNVSNLQDDAKTKQKQANEAQTAALTAFKKKNQCVQEIAIDKYIWYKDPKEQANLPFMAIDYQRQVANTFALQDKQILQQTNLAKMRNVVRNATELNQILCRNSNFGASLMAMENKDQALLKPDVKKQAEVAVQTSASLGGIMNNAYLRYRIHPSTLFNANKKSVRDFSIPQLLARDTTKGGFGFQGDIDELVKAKMPALNDVSSGCKVTANDLLDSTADYKSSIFSSSWNDTLTEDSKKYLSSLLAGQDVLKKAQTESMKNSDRQKNEIQASEAKRLLSKAKIYAKDKSEFLRNNGESKKAKKIANKINDKNREAAYKRVSKQTGVSVGKIRKLDESPDDGLSYKGSKIHEDNKNKITTTTLTKDELRKRIGELKSDTDRKIIIKKIAKDWNKFVWQVKRVDNGKPMNLIFGGGDHSTEDLESEIQKRLDASNNSNKNNTNYMKFDSSAENKTRKNGEGDIKANKFKRNGLVERLTFNGLLNDSQPVIDMDVIKQNQAKVADIDQRASNLMK